MIEIEQMNELIGNVSFTEIFYYYKKKSKTKYKENSFNFFEVVSEKYYYEDFHSDILASLLENSYDFFSNLIKLLNKNSKKIKININNYKNFNVKRERYVENKKRIDIFIESDTHVIIIENKINYAKDQPKQLFNYIKGIEKEDKKVDVIVYLTLFGEKEPDFKTYNENERKKVEEKLLLFSYLTSNEKITKDTIYSLLENTNNKAKKNNEEDLYCFIKQYNKLLINYKEEIMDYKKMDEFYEKIVKNDFEKSLEFYELFGQIDKYLIERIKKKIENDKIPLNKFKYRYYDDEFDKENFVCLIFESEDNDIVLEIRRWRRYDDDYNDKYMLQVYKWNDKKRNLDDLKKISEKFKMKELDYYKDWLRYYKTFHINDETKMTECLKDMISFIEKK